MNPDAERHDLIIIGAGVAGSRLLARLLADPARARRILVVERDESDARDHLLAFWTDRRSDLDSLIEHRWTALRVLTPSHEQSHPTIDERYAATRRARVIARASAAHPGVRWLVGVVEQVIDGPHEAAVRIGDRWHTAAWVFDSRRGPAGPATIRLVQRFVGWTVESTALRLDPAVATLFDFRCDQTGGLCFVYVLPFAPGRALIEHVSIGPTAAPPTDRALTEYLHTRLGLREGAYTIVAREQGCSPLTDQHHPRRLGRRVCAIGVRGGRLKPSSGYALTRIEADSAAIVRSLARHGDPFHLPRERRLYRVLDAIFLWVLACEPGRAPAIFAALMRRPDATLRFLDERPRLTDLLHLLLVLPTWVFLRAAWRWLWARRR